MKRERLPVSERGIGAIKTILLTFFLIIVAWIVFAEGRKAYLDHQVQELCAKDGGVKVYETVKVPAEKFDKYGHMKIPSKADATPGDLYFYEWKVTYIRKGNPEMYRDHYRIFRHSDGKLLGESVGYARRGGDMPSPSHNSSYRCPKLEQDQPGLDTLVFLKGDK